MSSRQRNAEKRREHLEAVMRSRVITPEHQQAIDEYESWLAVADKRFGEGAGVVIVALVTNWLALEKFQ
jgi:hypothetical protein